MVWVYDERLLAYLYSQLKRTLFGTEGAEIFEANFKWFSYN